MAEPTFSSVSGSKEFVAGPIRLTSGKTHRNVVHTALDGFVVQWTVINFQAEKVGMAHKYATTRTTQEEAQRSGFVSIPDGTFARMRVMAVEELRNEKHRQKEARTGGQQSLFSS